MRVLVIGNGQLGQILRDKFHEASSCVCDGLELPQDHWFKRGYDDMCACADHHDLDIANATAVKDFFKSRPRYDLIINAAAYTNVDGCEKEEALSFKVNALGPMYLSRAAADMGAKFVQVSTDYVFSGREDGLRLESDLAQPLSAYGRGKYAGEILSLNECEKTFVVRTAWLYSPYGKNFVKTMCRLGRSNGKLSVVNDQFGCPTSVADLAEAILCLAATEQYGIYHAVNSGVCSWYDFALRIIKGFNIKAEVEPISTEEYCRRFPASAQRPKFSALNNAKIQRVANFKLRSWEEAFDECCEIMLASERSRQ